MVFTSGRPGVSMTTSSCEQFDSMKEADPRLVATCTARNLSMDGSRIKPIQSICGGAGQKRCI